MIKQLIQIPDTLSPVIPIAQMDGTKLWEDAARNGMPVFLALTDDDKVLPLVIENTGEGTLDLPVECRQAIHCPICGQKMWLAPHADTTEPLVYECPCGRMMRVKTE